MLNRGQHFSFGLEQFFLLSDMAINIHELIEFIAELCDKKNIRVAATESLKGGAICGLSAFLGGILLGPVGIAVGGALGGIGSAVTANNFQPLGTIVREMPLQEKKKLAAQLMQIVHSIGIEDITVLAMFIVSNSDVEASVIRALTNFFSNEMKMRIKS